MSERYGKDNLNINILNVPINPERRIILQSGVAGLLLCGLSACQAGSTITSGIALPNGVRRVITGHNAQGRSYIVSDDRVAGGAHPNLYRATGDLPLGPAPAGESQGIRPTDREQTARLEPDTGGSTFTFVTLAPTPKGATPGWHRTMTLDYDIVLGGELVLMVDEGETKLYPGDVVLQRNTMHAWRNDTDAPVYFVAVMVPIRRQP